MAQHSTFWKLLLLASSVAAGVSLLTTAVGLDRYLHAALAWPLAFAVQAGLFGLAWLIAISHQPGQKPFRLLVGALYLFTMPFSVLFSYVMLQSQLTAEIRPLEAQRSLLDELRSHSSQVATGLQGSLAASDELLLRLDGWLDLERRLGWSTTTCNQADHCYLENTCSRLRAKIETWEQRSGATYREGPGEKLIYGLLELEKSEIERIRTTLAESNRAWLESNTELTTSQITNRERLSRYDSALRQLPFEEIRKVRCEPLELPAVPDYADHARDASVAEENPLYAFQDLLDIGAALTGELALERRDFPTLFAFGLALFIDLFVLTVAIAAGILGATEARRSSRDRLDLDQRPLRNESLSRDIGRWIDGALIDSQSSADGQRHFLTGLLDKIRFRPDGTATLVAADPAQSRFGNLMVSDRAARTIQSEETSHGAFELEGWVFPALSRYRSYC